MKDRAVPIRAHGNIHWGWFVKVRGRGLTTVTACGLTASCCGSSKMSTSAVRCAKCKRAAKLHPDLIKGKS